MGRKKAKQQKLEMTVAYIHRRFGPQSLVKGRPTAAAGAAPGAKRTVPHIATGFPALDSALEIGGLPKGRISEILGLPTSGKTTLALKFMAQAQVGGGEVVYVDQARYFDPDYAHRCGLDLSRLLVGTPYDLHEALAMTEALARNSELAALVFDALDLFCLDPEARRQLMAMLNRLIGPLAHSGTALLFVRTVSAQADAPAFAALAHYAAVRLQVVREQWIRHHGDIRGYEARVEVLKNRFGPAGRSANLKIEFNGTVRGNGL
jgi:recombination protein RecA